MTSIDTMEIAISSAKGLLSSLVRRALHGEEILLTRHGRPIARIVPIEHVPDAEEKRALLREISEAVVHKQTAGPCAARSQDFLYGEDGMP